MGNKNKVFLLCSVIVFAVILGGFSFSAYALKNEQSESEKILTEKSIGVSSKDEARIFQENSAGKIGMEAAERAQSLFPDIYAGVELTNDGSAVKIYLTKLSTEITSSIKNNIAADKILFHKSPNSLKQMLSIQEKVKDAFSDLKNNKDIKIVTFGPHIKAGKVKIEVENLTESEKKYLIEKFGESNIIIEDINPDDVPKLWASRVNDYAPWNGGDLIRDYRDALCTSGFPVHDSNNEYLLTAGHCFTEGLAVYNSSTYMGFISDRDFTNYGLDTELIDVNGGSSDLIWIGSATNPVIAQVTGATTSPVGYEVCQSGALSGEICDLVIKDNNLCVDFGVLLCDLVKTQHQYGNTAGQPGDSGGTFLTHCLHSFLLLRCFKCQKPIQNY
ncbi:S1 family peptidase [Lederbergia graminis]|uniref:S1 family peptidase n=2 Tax=Lederbergia graminis TaxID=735518 RepID=A0ABW0LGD6_9BACI